MVTMQAVPQKIKSNNIRLFHGLCFLAQGLLSKLHIDGGFIFFHTHKNQERIKEDGEENNYKCIGYRVVHYRDRLEFRGRKGKQPQREISLP